MTRQIVVVGGGGHARVLIEALKLQGAPLLGVADPAPKEALVAGIPVRGDDDWVLSLARHEVALVVAVGSVGRPSARARIFERFNAAGFAFAAVVHPSASISPDARISGSVQVMAGCVVQTGVDLGENVLLNTRACVDHDSKIGAHTHIAPGATICGDVAVGTASHIGAGSVVIQGRRIGDRCLIGAGAVVLDDIPDGATAYGNPAQLVAAKSF